MKVFLVHTHKLDGGVEAW